MTASDMEADLDEALAERDEARGELEEARGELEEARGELEEARGEVGRLGDELEEALCAEAEPPAVPEGYRVVKKDGRWILSARDCGSPLVGLAGDFQHADVRAVMALCWAILNDDVPPHAWTMRRIGDE